MTNPSGHSGSYEVKCVFAFAVAESVGFVPAKCTSYNFDFGVLRQGHFVIRLRSDKAMEKCSSTLFSENMRGREERERKKGGKEENGFNGNDLSFMHL